MNVLLIYLWIWMAMIAASFWESRVEGRNTWDKAKFGWKINFAGFKLTEYHFWLFWVMFPLLITLPLIISGWDSYLFKILLSAYFSGIVLEDFFWYVTNPKVKLKEFWTQFSDYYPWIKIKGKKILPLLYVIGVAASIIIRMI